jgi:hypothetical protein
MRMVWLVFAAGCGGVPGATDAGSNPGDGTGDGSGSNPGDAAIDTPGSDTCKTFTGVFQNDATAFDSSIAPTTRQTFEMRGDGVTAVTSGTVVPRDEYLACCGFQLEFLGNDPGGTLIWAGNPVTGFDIRAKCMGTPKFPACKEPSGVRVTFVPPVTAVGIEYPGSTTVTVFDTSNTSVATMQVSGSGAKFFLGYESKVKLSRLETFDSVGENIETLLYHRCD